MSSDCEELEIQNQVEIESDSVDIPCDAVDMDGRSIVSLQALQDNRDDLILETTEEVVGCGDDALAYEEIPLEQDINYIEAIPGPSRRLKKTNRRMGTKFRESEQFLETSEVRPNKKWEQKKVQIKTLEGEFSVTMWASGTDEGKPDPSNHFVDTEPVAKCKMLPLRTMASAIIDLHLVSVLYPNWHIPNTVYSQIMSFTTYLECCLGF